jgi:hypothetical protein
VLELRVAAVLTTYDRDDLLGEPPLDKAYRAREVDFLLRNVVLGANIPAPVPPVFASAVQVRADT